MTNVDDMADEFELPPPDKLALHHRRQLSAMLDGELSPDEARFMLRRLQHDDELAACWERWQVCGDMLRGRGQALLPADFAQRVSSAIANGGEATLAPLVATRSSRRARWGGSAALAASVAVVAFFVARQLPGEVVPAATDAPTDLAIAATQAADPPAAPARDTVATQAPGVDQAASALAGAAAAAGPRRAAQRRSRGQSQRVANRSQRRTAGQQKPVMVAAGQRAATPNDSPPAVPSVFAVNGGRADPFATQVTATERPWPQAILPGLSSSGGNFTVGSAQSVATSVNAAFHPFEPRPRAVDSTQSNEDAVGAETDDSAVEAIPAADQIP